MICILFISLINLEQFYAILNIFNNEKKNCNKFFKTYNFLIMV